MFDLSEIQAAYYMVAATGVLVAAVYYIQNMRTAERNKKIQLSQSVTDRCGTKDFNQTFVELVQIQWSDLNDFLRRYDSAVTTEEARDNFGKRWWIWSTYDNLGYLLRQGLVDDEIIFNSGGWGSVIFWGHYWPVVEYYRRKEMGPRWLENFEYLAGRMWVLGKEHGSASPGFKDGLFFDAFKDIFEKGPATT